MILDDPFDTSGVVLTAVCLTTWACIQHFSCTSSNLVVCVCCTFLFVLYIVILSLLETLLAACLPCVIALLDICMHTFCRILVAVLDLAACLIQYFVLLLVFAILLVVISHASPPQRQDRYHEVKDGRSTPRAVSGRLAMDTWLCRRAIRPPRSISVDKPSRRKPGGT